MRDQFLFGSRIGTRLFLTGALLVVITGVVLAFVSASSARMSILQEAERRVLALVEQRQSHLENWLDLYFEYTRAVLLEQGDPAELTASEWSSRIGQVDGLLAAVLFDQNGADLERITAPTEIDSSARLPGGPPVFNPDSTALTAAALSRTIAYSSVVKSADGTPVLDVVLPVRTEDYSAALLALRLATRHTLNPIMTDTSGLGKLGEVFLLDREMRMLTPSRMHDHPDPLEHKMEIPPAKAGLENERGALEYTSFLGNPVVGGYVYLPRQRWILVGELDVREALAPLSEIFIRALLVVIFALVAVIGLTFGLARSWARPILRLTHASERVAAGDYSIRLNPRRTRDEISSLTSSFNHMVEALERSRDELHAAQRRLVQQEKMAEIGRLVAGIVHEMRNPLSSIKVNLRLMQRSLPKNCSESESLELAAGEVMRLETMLQELLEYGKPVEVHLQRIDIIGLIDAAVGELRDQAEEQGIEIEKKVAENAAAITSDPELLRRTLVNLLRNSVEASESGGHVIVEAVYEDKQAVIRVIDQGRGMPEQVRERLFDPFFTTREQGTGLGMSNVRKFAETLGAELKIESEEGHGTTISLILPEER